LRGNPEPRQGRSPFPLELEVFSRGGNPDLEAGAGIIGLCPLKRSGPANGKIRFRGSFQLFLKFNDFIM
jgi:hypothetical protein